MAKSPRSGGVKRVEGESDLTPDVMQALLSQLATSRNSEEVDAAQDIMFDAWECDDRRKRISLARKALKVSPLCADAYTLLAQETAKTPQEALDLYQNAFDAGEQALGKAAFDEDVGMFWGLIETRPYMRARQGLASALWEVGRLDEAVAHLGDMLRLNPNDNQGLRYLLIDWLQQLGRDAEAARLFKRYRGDAAAAWLWPAALAAFRKSGDGTASRTALRRALAANYHVRDYLMGRARLPRDLPPFILQGEAPEAAAYAARAEATWSDTPGALPWLATQTRNRGRSDAGPPA